LIIKTTINPSWQELTQEEITIYEHLDYLVHSYSSSKIITEFNRLIILGKGEENSKVRVAWENIFLSQSSQDFFNLVIYRCCLIIINSWLTEPELRKDIYLLISLFTGVSSETTSCDRRRKILVERISKFKETEKYLKLQRLIKISEANNSKNSADRIVIGDLIKRYPFLYKYCLLGEDHLYEEEKTIQKLEYEEQKAFEVKFSQYIIYRARLLQIARARQLSHGAGKLIRKIDNPTLLSEKQIKKAIKQYIGKIDSQHTCWQLAHRFLAEHRLPTTYQIFKYNLYQYLVYSLEAKYSQYNFQHRLKKKIENIFPEYNSQKLDRALLRRTCNQLIKFLTIENAQQCDPYPFIDLVTNLGVSATIGLLMRIVVLSPDLKPELEKRFAIFFMHYESLTEKQAPWLLKSLENLQIAFSIYFGKVDLSVTKLIY
jgi:hypothetical protein